MIASYYAFANNASKRMVEIFYWIGIIIIYETVQCAFQANAKAILEELKTQMWKKQFLVFFDNMNFYEKQRDERLYNKPIQLIYIMGYISFMHLDYENENASYEKTFLRANHVDYDMVNQLVAKHFATSSDN